MFTGYSDRTVDVFWGIRFNNDRAWFAEHKQEFQDAVMTPTKALAGELYDGIHQRQRDAFFAIPEYDLFDGGQSKAAVQPSLWYFRYDQSENLGRGSREQCQHGDGRQRNSHHYHQCDRV